MKRLFHLLFLLMLVGLTYLSYLQWFSPSSPVEYYLPAKSVAPKHLDTLQVQNFQGNQQTIHMKDSPVTLFVVDSYKPEFTLYSMLSPFQKRFGEKGVRMIFVWNLSFEGENVKEQIMNLVDQENSNEIYIADERILKEYESLGIKIRGRHLFAYNQEGELIYEHDGGSYSKVTGELIQRLFQN